MVCHRDSRSAGLWRSAGCLHSAAARPLGGNELLHSRRPGRDRQDHQSQGRFPAPVAAPVLVLRPSRGVHRHSARHGRGLARPLDVLAQAGVRLSRHGLRPVRNRFPRLLRVGHHMFVSGMSPYSAFAFSLLTMSIGVPSAIKTFNWLGTLWGGNIQFTCAMLFAIGFVSLFVTGGLSGLFLAQPSLDLYL